MAQNHDRRERCAAAVVSDRQRCQRRRPRPCAVSFDRATILLLCSIILLLCLDTCLGAACSRRVLRDDEVERMGPPEDEYRQSTLTDVWLCLACALGWTVWMVASHVRPPMERYATEGMTVYGNVLQSYAHEDGEFSGIPTYHAVVDYVLEDHDHEPTTTQVRKNFQTSILLEEGFANVEVLVLPTDPTSGVLKKDWEREYDEYQEASDKRKGTRRWSLILGAILVTISIVGAVMAVQRLPVERLTWGWVSIVVGLLLLWPVAVLLYVNGNAFLRIATRSRQGVIIRGKQPPLPFSLNPCGAIYVNDMSTPKQSNRKIVNPPSKDNKSAAIELPNIKGVITPPALRPMSPVEEPRVGCYFINLPKRQQSSQERSSVSSVSTSRSDLLKNGSSSDDNKTREIV